MQPAIDIITDTFSKTCTDGEMEKLEKSALHLYGLIHARYILTNRGLQKMLEKYRDCDFGRCPRVHCDLHPLLPIGLHDSSRQAAVRLYCSKCEDLYVPKSSRHATIDGAYFGTSFPGMFLQVHSSCLPEKPTERFVPKIFGFKIHKHAKLARWQEKQRQEMLKRIDDKGPEEHSTKPPSASQATK